MSNKKKKSNLIFYNKLNKNAVLSGYVLNMKAF